METPEKEEIFRKKTDYWIDYPSFNKLKQVRNEIIKRPVLLNGMKISPVHISALLENEYIPETVLKKLSKHIEQLRQYVANNLSQYIKPLTYRGCLTKWSLDIGLGTKSISNIVNNTGRCTLDTMLKAELYFYMNHDHVLSWPNYVLCKKHIYEIIGTELKKSYNTYYEQFVFLERHKRIIIDCLKAKGFCHKSNTKFYSIDNVIQDETE